MNWTKTKIIIVALGVAAILLGISFMSMKEFSVYFYTPSEAIQKAMELSTKTVRVGGMVKEGSMVWDPQALSLRFLLTDLSGTHLNVAFHGSRPDLFKENSGAVVEGVISQDGQSFLARKIFVKHSEEYRPPNKNNSMDKQLLEQSLFKE